MQTDRSSPYAETNTTPVAPACGDSARYSKVRTLRTHRARIGVTAGVCALALLLSACGGDRKPKTAYGNQGAAQRQQQSAAQPASSAAQPASSAAQSAASATHTHSAETPHSAHSAATSHGPHVAVSHAGGSSAAASNASGAVTVPESGVIVIESDDRMRFDITEFIVKPGQKIQLTLRHTGRMPVNAMGHNIAILKQYTDVRAFAQAAARSASTDYIPRGMRNQVIAHTRMLGGGQDDTITFTAPAEPGEYDFLCTFPAHFAAGMKGKMIVKN